MITGLSVLVLHILNLKSEIRENVRKWCATRQVDNENILIFSAWCFCQAVFMLLTLIVRGIPSA